MNQPEDMKLIIQTKIILSKKTDYAPECEIVLWMKKKFLQTKKGWLISPIW